MNDEKYMSMCIELAKKARGNTKTNPLVGSVIVKNGKVISTGYHQVFGEAHAEVNAIKNCKEDLSGATLYVNLEPCAHFGKTPPCANLIVEKNIQRVVVGCIDANKEVSGKGIQILKDAGIQVDVNVLSEECIDLNRDFFHYIKTGLPYVMVKFAQSLDGKIATKEYDSKWISNEKSRKYVHKLRSEFEAIMVGIGTVLKDDPSLNARIENGIDPHRIIVDSNLRFPLNSKMLDLETNSKTIIFTTNKANKDKIKELENKDVIVEIVSLKDNRVDLEEVLKILGQRGIKSLMLEGGGTLNYSMLKAGLINEVNAFIAPKIIGGKDAFTAFEGEGFSKMSEVANLKNISTMRFDDDILIRGEIQNVYRSS